MTTGIITPRNTLASTIANGPAVEPIEKLNAGSNQASPLQTSRYSYPSKNSTRSSLSGVSQSDQPTSAKPRLTTEKKIGVFFQHQLDSEAYASCISRDPRFEALVVARHSGLQASHAMPLDLLLTDHCFQANSTTALNYRVGDYLVAVSQVIRIPKTNAQTCNCCRVIYDTVSWNELLNLMAISLGLSAISNNYALISPEKNTSSTQPNRKLTPASRRGLPEELDALTRREIDILQLVGMGLSVREMAGRLKLAESTIGNHKYRLMRKLKVTSSLGLLRIAVRCGLSEL